MPYTVYLDKDEIMMLDSKKFDIDSSDHIIIDDVRYVSTPGLYELIIPTDVYTEDDKRKYKTYCWLQTRIDAITRSTAIYRATRYEYSYIIAPLLKDESMIGERLPRAMTLNDNAINYVHLGRSQ